MVKGMMYIFPALTFFIGLSLPSALPLYWAAASLIAILQQYLVLQRDVRELEDGTPAAVTPQIPAKVGPKSAKSSKKGKRKGGK
jgi:membrane protein insertase Oxa1/YidC/SpoIIIJ